MIEGRASKRYDLVEGPYMLLIADYEKNKCWTIEFKEKDLPGRYSTLGEDTTTFVKPSDFPLMAALAKCLQDMEIMPKDANKSELEATKKHLEDIKSYGSRILGLVEKQLK